VKSGDLRTAEHLGGIEEIETAEESSGIGSIGWVVCRPSDQPTSQRGMEKSVLERRCFLDLFAQ
jgi:hypothetical protein